MPLRYGLIAPCYRQSLRLFAPSTKMHQQLPRPRKGERVIFLELRSSSGSRSFTSNTNASPPSASSSAGTSTTKETAPSTTESRNANATSRVTHPFYSSFASSASTSASKIATRAKDNAFRLATRTAEHVSNKAKDAVDKAKESMRTSIVEASTSLNDRVKKTIAKRMPESFTATATTTTTTKHHNILSSARESISQQANAASNQLTLSQSTIIKSAYQTAIEASNQLQDVAKKTLRWLWWWGLAAVGVYGISTTLTKEGIHVLKELITSSRQTLTSSSLSSSAAGETGLNCENDENAIVDYEECTDWF